MKRKYSYSINKYDFFTISYLLVSFFCVSTIGQLNDDFSDGNLTNPTWQGDLGSFVVNASGQMQLKAAAAGTSTLFTKYKFPKDSIEVSFWFKMQFAPSGDNNAKIYLFTDRIDDLNLSGYYMTIGENGSFDAIKVWRSEAGNATLLGTGSMGAMASDPALVRIKSKITSQGMWTIASDYTGAIIFTDDIQFVEPIIQLPDSVYFGVKYNYTATRADKFFMDDIRIATIEKDITPPTLVSAKAIEDRNVILRFDEPVTSTSATITDHYLVDNSVGSPTSAVWHVSMPNEVTLVFESGILKSGIEYLVTAMNVKDISGNSKGSSATFSFAVAPTKGDLAITEILTDPLTGGDDFVEIYNRSDKTLNLDGLVIINIGKNERKTISPGAILGPKKYLAFSRNIDFLRNTYLTPDDSNLRSEVLPSMNVSDAYVGIELNGIRLDSFEYREPFHFELLDETKGVSLERIRIDGPSNDRNNWHSASSQVKHATPGYKNSQLDDQLGEKPDNFVTIDKEIITPNGDGTDDFVRIQFDLDKPGYLGTIKIFDAEGYFVRDLENNALLPQTGSIKWDGVDGENNRMRMGIYILYIRLFHADGDIKECKKVVTVSDDF